MHHINKIAIENPISVISSNIRKARPNNTDLICLEIEATEKYLFMVKELPK